MNPALCSQEAAVAKAVRTGRWNPEMEAHAAVCSVCKEVAQAARWMQALAQPAAVPAVSPTAGDAPMPDASWLWCRALLDQKQAEARGARRRLAAAEMGCAALMALLLAGWLRWNWPAVEASLSGLETSLRPQLWRAVAWFLMPSAGDLFSLTATLLLALAGVAALLASYPLLSEE